MKNFTELYNLDISKMVETITSKDKYGKPIFTARYLSWAFAIKLLKESYPESSWVLVNYPDSKGNIVLPYLTTDAGYFVTINLFLTKDDRLSGFSHSFTHPVLDNRHKPIQMPNSFDINTSFMRGLTKLIGMVTGIGLSLYSGEDLPKQENNNPDPDPKPVHDLEQKDIKKTKTYQSTKDAFNACKTELDLNLSLNKINDWLKGKGQPINPDWVIDLYKIRFESLPKEAPEPTEKPATYLPEVKKNKSDIRKFLEDCTSSEDVRLIYEAYNVQIEADVLLGAIYKAQCDKFQVKTVLGSDVAEKAIKELK
jgi:hypothetical protein